MKKIRSLEKSLLFETLNIDNVEVGEDFILAKNIKSNAALYSIREKNEKGLKIAKKRGSKIPLNIYRTFLFPETLNLILYEEAVVIKGKRQKGKVLIGKKLQKENMYFFDED